MESGGSECRLLPLSLWPTVLERTYRKSGPVYRACSTKKINNATGLNYLVREVGPALIGRSIALRAQSGNDTVVDNGDEYDGDDGNGESDSNDIAVPERKRKRKLVDNEK